MIEMRDPKSLRQHPVNHDIYGDEVLDDEFVASIRENGILEPLRVSNDGVVISGHRRLAAALVLGLSAVPCLATNEIDFDLVCREIVESNRQRVKTNEQRAREAALLLQVQSNLAAKRSRANLKRGAESPEVATLPPRENQRNNSISERSRDHVGAIVGMSGRSVAAAVAVIKRIDEAKAAGDDSTAFRLTRTLNSKGAEPALRVARSLRTGPVTAATEEASDASLDTVARLEQTPSLGAEFDAIKRDGSKLMRRIRDLGSQPGGEFVDPHKQQEIQDKLGNGLSALMGARPYRACPYCLGDGCQTCRGSGCVTRMIFENAPEQKRDAALRVLPAVHAS